MSTKPTILMHACCAVCATHPFQLLSADYDLTLYYYNPNIHPEEEYERRLDGIKFISQKYDIPLVIGKYDPERWFEAAKGLEHEPEGGDRCLKCFRLRLEESARKARGLGFTLYGTTLSVSPHKNAEAINNIGKAKARSFDIDFYTADFKKKGWL
ncbi:MAG: epoxyqueuosine reductase QueH [Actinomycetota bacterium]|nr:epoxyqueuosine reductase QueH [Actinomycetota bacterium]